MSAPDTTSERVARIVRDETRRAYLRTTPGVVRCIECGEEVDPDSAYSAVDGDGCRGYVCPPCNLDPIHDED